MVDLSCFTRNLVAYAAAVSGIPLAAACEAEPAGHAAAQASPPNSKPSQASPANTPVSKQAAGQVPQVPGTRPSQSASAKKPSSPAKPAENPGLGLPGYLIGDPPLVEGFNIEESTCVTGNWCGPSHAAVPLMVDSLGESAGCPKKLSGARARPTDVEASVYEGLSSERSMQGTFQPWRTERTRESRGDDKLCCYHWFNYCSGRPLITEHGKVRAKSLATQADAPQAFAGDMTALEPTTFPALARANDEAAPAPDTTAEAFWLERAADEHASIASFARSTLELMAVGAPMSLIVDSQRAGLDESRHTEICLEIAAHFGHRNHSLGPLPIAQARSGDLASLAENTFWEACVGETIAALIAQHQADQCRDPALSARLAKIAEDEQRHAGLGWATLRWALHREPDRVSQTIERALTTLRSMQQASTEAGDASSRSESAASAQQLARAGMLSRQRALQIADSARETLIPQLWSELSADLIG